MREFKKNGEQSYTHRDGQTDKTFTYKTGEEGRPLTQREPSWCDKYPRHPRCQEVKKPFTRDRDPVEVDFLRIIIVNKIPTMNNVKDIIHLFKLV